MVGEKKREVGGEGEGRQGRSRRKVREKKRDGEGGGERW